MSFSLSFGAVFLWRRRVFPGAQDLEFYSLVRERSAVGIHHRVARLGIDEQSVSVTGLEAFGEVNLIFQPGGRVLRQVIRGDRAVCFVEDSNPVVVNWQICGELQMPGRLHFREMPSVQVETRHASIG